MLLQRCVVLVSRLIIHTYIVPIALGFAFVEQILTAPENDVAAVTALSLLETTRTSLDVVGFQRIVYEDFYDVLYGLIKSVVQPDDGQLLLTLASLLETFQKPEGVSYLPPHSLHYY